MQFHVAVNVTVPAVARRFLNVVAVIPDKVVALVVCAPYVCAVVSIPLIFQPLNVACSCVGLFTVNPASNVALAGCDAPYAPPFSVYAILYVFAVHVARNAILPYVPLPTLKFVLPLVEEPEPQPAGAVVTVQPAKVYPVMVGLLIVNVASVTLYVSG